MKEKGIGKCKGKRRNNFIESLKKNTIIIYCITMTKRGLNKIFMICGLLFKDDRPVMVVILWIIRELHTKKMLWLNDDYRVLLSDDAKGNRQ